MASCYDYNVFINCPFDAPYRPMLYALVFTVHDRGFRARCTLEIDNIYTLIRECRFGIHDISRTELSEEHRLPRFNMPLELGLFLGATRFGSGRQKEKGCLILDRERYQKYISDIAGQDIKSHDGRSEVAIGKVRDWLDNALDEPGVIKTGGRKIAERYGWFMDELPELCEEVHLDPDELTFNNSQNVLMFSLLLANVGRVCVKCICVADVSSCGRTTEDHPGGKGE